jgi:hypothetical protein
MSDGVHEEFVKIVFEADFQSLSDSMLREQQKLNQQIRQQTGQQGTPGNQASSPVEPQPYPFAPQQTTPQNFPNTQQQQASPPSPRSYPADEAVSNQVRRSRRYGGDENYNLPIHAQQAMMRGFMGFTRMLGGGTGLFGIPQTSIFSIMRMLHYGTQAGGGGFGRARNIPFANLAPTIPQSVADSDKQSGMQLSELQIKNAENYLKSTYKARERVTKAVQEAQKIGELVLPKSEGVMDAHLLIAKELGINFGNFTSHDKVHGIDLVLAKLASGGGGGNTVNVPGSPVATPPPMPTGVQGWITRQGGMQKVLQMAATALTAAVAIGEVIRSYVKAAGEVAGGAKKIGASLVTADASTALKGAVEIFQGIARGLTTAVAGSAGAIIGILFGPIGIAIGAMAGPILGGMVSSIIGKITSIITGMDSLVDALAHWNPVLLAQSKAYEVQQIFFRMRMAAAMQPALSAWLNMKSMLLDSLAKLAPLINQVAQALVPLINMLTSMIPTAIQSIMDGIAYFVGFIGTVINQFGGAITTAINGILQQFLGPLAPTFPGFGGAGAGLVNAANTIGIAAAGITAGGPKTLTAQQQEFQNSFIQSIGAAGRANGQNVSVESARPVPAQLNHLVGAGGVVGDMSGAAGAFFSAANTMQNAANTMVGAGTVMSAAARASRDKMADAAAQIPPELQHPQNADEVQKLHDWLKAHPHIAAALKPRDITSNLPTTDSKTLDAYRRTREMILKYPELRHSGKGFSTSGYTFAGQLDNPEPGMSFAQWWDQTGHTDDTPTFPQTPWGKLGISAQEWSDRNKPSTLWSRLGISPQQWSERLNKLHQASLKKLEAQSQSNPLMDAYHQAKENLRTDPTPTSFAGHIIGLEVGLVSKGSMSKNVIASAFAAAQGTTPSQTFGPNTTYAQWASATGRDIQHTGAADLLTRYTQWATKAGQAAVDAAKKTADGSTPLSGPPSSVFHPYGASAGTVFQPGAAPPKPKTDPGKAYAGSLAKDGTTQDHADAGKSVHAKAQIPQAKLPNFMINTNNTFQMEIQNEQALTESMMQVREKLLRSLDVCRNEVHLLVSTLEGSMIANGM